MLRRSLFPLLLLPMVLALSACGDDLEQASFNVWFTHPDGRQELLKRSTGLQRCRATAQARADYMELAPGRWDYHCCLRDADSECARKLK